MTLSTGDSLPDVTLLTMTDKGPAPVSLADKTKGRKIVLFGLPGAFTGVCTTAHVPSFLRNAEAFAAKGVDEIICLSVNDPFVMAAWAGATGAGEAITFLADPEATLTKAMGLNFSAPPAGLIDRCQRVSMLLEDGVVTVLHLEESPGSCEISAGETLLAEL
ncbi:peroxiredoxin [Pseudooceanicola sp. 200-1SW]|uniref:peroxiredoxin n=1 Tax=Pseudooceanicola sp. 200-1SW TaxID=3425949 RepID=UPI003D7FF427